MNPLVEYPRTADLAYWINEREAIRQRKESGTPGPWTTDPNMANVRYCNVHREDDKVTRYIRGCAVYSRPAVPAWVVVLGRMLNRISTLEAVKDAVQAGDLQVVKSILKTLRHDDRIWGNAYTISTCGKSMDKVDYVIDHVVQTVKDNDHMFFESTCEKMFAKLTSFDGLGSFLAGQVVADLKNIKGHPLATASDWWAFAVPGPGSLKGLLAYYGAPCTPSTFDAALAGVTAHVTPLLLPYVAPIHAQDMQNCMCEFSKYIRVREGGRARNKYDQTNRS